MVPVIGCLNVAEEILGPERDWQGENPDQVRFLRDFYDKGRNQMRDLQGLESIADRDPSVVNSFLAARHFSIELPPAQGPNPFYVASVFKALIRWLQVGEVTTVRNRYPAVRMGAGMTRVLESPDWQNPIGQIRTQSGDQVFMTVVEQFDGKAFDLVDLAIRIEREAHHTEKFSGVVFPMIDYDAQVDISWLEGMHTVGSDGHPAVIEKALQQTKVKMNEVGVRVESAVGMSMMRMNMLSGPLVIDRPFLLWIRRDGVEQPLFVGHFYEDTWKNPGKIF